MIEKIKAKPELFYFAGAVILALAVLLAQTLGSTVLIVICLSAFLALAGAAAWQGFATPVLIFFLPWAKILKISPDSYSFYTFAIILVCLITLVRRKNTLNLYCAAAAVLVFVVSLISKLIGGCEISTAYIMFIFMLALFPMFTDELRGRVNGRVLTVFFATGIIIAGISAPLLAEIPTIARYIDIDAWNIVKRFSGYYGDANYYSAHVTSALAATLLMFLREETKLWRAISLVLSLVLVYCGFLSISKTFFIVLALMVMCWFWRFFTMKGRITEKIIVLAGIVLIVAVIIFSGALDSQWEAFMYRFSFSSTLSDFTTHRTEWIVDYSKAIISDWRLILVGNGISKALVNDTASHNTAIQITYQLGLIGLVLLLAWEYFFHRDIIRTYKPAICVSEAALLLIGTFLPWLSLDIMLFDEFFILQLYVLALVMYFGKSTSDTNEKPAVNAEENNEKIVTAHKFSSNHKEELQKDEKCGCFYCLKIFAPAEIKEWIPDAKGTAICPYCGVDSVIGEYSGFPITSDFLSKMKKYWF